MPEAMLGPEELIQGGESLDGFAAPSGDFDQSEVRCGIGRFSSQCLQRFATIKWFLVLLISLTVLQGAAQGYLMANVPVIANRFGLPNSFVDWFMIGHEVTQGLLGMIIAFFGGRSCRASWLAVCIVIQAVCQFVVCIPLIIHGANSVGTNNITETREWLCTTTRTRSVETEDVELFWSTLVVLVIAQLGTGIGLTSFIAHGISYLDDNSEKTDSPALLGAVLCATQVGPKLGQILAYWCSAFSGAISGNMVVGNQLNGAWWLGWPVLSCFMIVMAFFVAMFPRRLPSMAVKEAAASILDLAVGGHVQISEERQYIVDPPDPGFCPTLVRLLTNKMLMSNILAMLCMHVALTNFNSYEDRYLESVYYIPRVEFAGGAFDDQWVSRVITGFLKPAIVGMALLLSGLIVSRKQPRAKVLALWNLALALFASIIFFCYISLGCPLLHIYGTEENRLRLTEACNSNCQCPLYTPFMPVCDKDGINTYYSPCHAGCTSVQTISDIKLYEDCSCISFGQSAKSGPCSSLECKGMWVLFQSLGVLMVGLLGTGMVGSMLLCLRCVQPQDKPALFGLELTIIGIMQVPGKLVYKYFITDSNCKHWGDNTYTCRLFNSEEFVTDFNMLTATLFLMASFFLLFVWGFSHNLNLYGDDGDSGSVEELELTEAQRQKISKRRATPALRRRRKDGQNGGIDVQDEEEEARQNEGENREEPQEVTELLENSPPRQQQNNVRRINATLV